LGTAASRDGACTADVGRVLCVAVTVVNAASVCSTWTLIAFYRACLAEVDDDQNPACMPTHGQPTATVSGTEDRCSRRREGSHTCRLVRWRKLPWR
jgi:FlaG/FlaF family flagellin (archaellin)